MKINPDSWRDAGGAIGSLSQMMGLIVIAQPDEVQNEIAELLVRISRLKNDKIDSDLSDLSTTTAP